MSTTDITVRRLEADEFDVLRRVRLAALADAPEMFQQILAQAVRSGPLGFVEAGSHGFEYRASESYDGWLV
jgi:hypothetical protein